MNETPTAIVKTDIGILTIRVHSADRITLDSDVYENGKRTDNNVEINRVGYRLNLTCVLNPKTGVFEREHEYLSRCGSFGQDYTWAALKKAREVCVAFINNWAKSHPEVLSRGEKVYLEDDIERKQKDLAELDEKREALRREIYQLEIKLAQVPAKVHVSPDATATDPAAFNWAEKSLKPVDVPKVNEVGK